MCRWNSKLCIVAFMVLVPCSEFPAGAQEQAPSSTVTNSDRVLWTTSRLTGTPDAPPPYVVERIFPAIQFQNPVDIVADPDGQHIYVAELSGRIWAIDLRDPQSEKRELIANLSEHIESARSLLGFTLHPQFSENRQLFVCYVDKAGVADGSVISRFTLPENSPLSEKSEIDYSSELPIIRWLAGGHNGCCLKFGADGCLYFSTGDAEAPSPPDSLNTGQNLTDLLSCILRIDVDHPEQGKNYAVPHDNPFVGIPQARGEIWAYGLRNPWRMSFDRQQRLWVGDVGWELWEMIYQVVRGGNYGWSVNEGPQPARLEADRGPTEILPPLVSHDHTESRSITGGYVYYGDRLPRLKNHYVYGDYDTGLMWSFPADDQNPSPDLIARTGLQIICFGVTRDEELLIVDYKGGLYRLLENPQQNANQDFPVLLSQTGIFRSTADQKPNPGVMPYQINAPMWSDYASGERFVALPGTAQLQVEPWEKQRQKFQWRYPQDTVLVKTLSLNMVADDPSTQRRMETQILQFTGEGNQVNAYSYAWNEAQDDATLVAAAGRDLDLQIRDASAPQGIRQQTWHFAARSECLVCHNDTIGGPIAFNSPQLELQSAQAKSGPSQLEQFFVSGLFDKPVSLDEPPLVNPHDDQFMLEQRAKSYLHVNCTFCHRFQGGGNATIELRNDFDNKNMQLIDLRPAQGTFGLEDARLIAAGDPTRSVLLYRLAKLGPGRMPRAGAQLIDQTGLELVADWIASLKPNQAPSARSLETRAQIVALQAKTDLPNSKLDEHELQHVVQFLSNTSSALALALWIDDLPLEHSARQQVLALVAQQDDLLVRDLFERFLPPAQRIARLGTVIDEQAILQLAGDPLRGKQLFFENAGVQCKACHLPAQDQSPIGPELKKVAAQQTRQQILRSILKPSEKIDAKFQTHLCETIDGQSIVGLLVSRDEKQVVIVDAQGKRHAIQAEDVELLAPQNISLMPELLVRDLTAQDVADLVEWIKSDD
jgi:putative heme-binding domain-containing protein